VHLSQWWNNLDSQSRARDRQESKIYLRLQEDTESEGLIYGLELAVMNARKVFSETLSRLDEIYDRLKENLVIADAFNKLASCPKESTGLQTIHEEPLEVPANVIRTQLERYTKN
jgi:hypothetical protein